MQADPDSTFIEPVPMDIESPDGDSSSELPALTLPKMITPVERAPSGRSTHSNSHNMDIPSVSRPSSPCQKPNPSFPHPLSTISLTDIQSPSESGSSPMAGPSGFRSRFKMSFSKGLNKVKRVGARRLVCRRRQCREHREKMKRVVRWLIDGCDSLRSCKCKVKGVGTQDDPLIIPDDSEEPVDEGE